VLLVAIRVGCSALDFGQVTCVVRFKYFDLGHNLTLPSPFTLRHHVPAAP
jgi:hypothetical protein